MFQWRKDILLDPPERVEECIVTMKGEKNDEEESREKKIGAQVKNLEGDKEGDLRGQRRLE